VDVTHEELARRLGEDGLTVLDVRSPAEYEGRLGAPCDPRQGHIPGALNLDVQELFGRGAVEVAEELGLEPGAEVIAYCHSGSRSAFAAEALRAVGYRARNYAGSWHEWSRDESLPVE
jgi:thiosulfate/3-mercaptopyruvate sulfurtransferase